MFIKSWIRTSLIWVGLLLILALNSGMIGYSAPYDVTIGDWVYTYQDPLPYLYFLYVLGVSFVLTGCYIWTKLKNRSWAFMLWGLVAPIGLLGIALLKDKSTSISSGAVAEPSADDEV